MLFQVLPKKPVKQAAGKKGESEMSVLSEKTLFLGQKVR